MAFERCDRASPPSLAATVKILVAGGFGVGKTTMVGSVSEIEPLRTEEVISEASADMDDLTGVERKTTTTVAIDFGRITLNPQLVLYLFGTPGQDRFWFMWDELARGALGAVVIVDTRKLGTSFAAVDFFERRKVPFIVAVNCFENAPVYRHDEIRDALDVDQEVPIVLCDVRRPEHGKDILTSLLEYLIRLHTRQPDLH